MPTGTTALLDLGSLAALDQRRLEAGVIVWDRFCVVGDSRAVDGATIVAVTDLERKLGDPVVQHRLELHLLPVPAGLLERGSEPESRLHQALALRSRVQPRVYASGRVGELLVLACEPAVGRPLDALTPRQLLALGLELAALLAELHAIELRGVRFTRAMLRVEDGHFGLDRFTHLVNQHRAGAANANAEVQADVDALLELLRSLGDAPPELSSGSSTTASELRRRLSNLIGTGAGDELELHADPPFIGRTRALTELGRGFDQAQIAQPTAVVIQGQRGVGKSRLMSEFVAARVEADDAIVLTGAWQEHSADSRGGLLSALEQLAHALARLSPDERDDVRSRINRATRHLGAIVTRSAPSLGAVLRNVEELPPLELGDDFSRHTAVIADLLRAIGTQKRPLVLVLDNLESVDVSSAAVLKILAQHRPAHHTLMVMGLRTGTGSQLDFDHELTELAPLTVGEIEQLLTGALPGEIADAEGLSHNLWAVSRGLPLVAWTNLRAWIERGRLTRGIDDEVWRARGALREDADGRLDVHDVFGPRLASAAEPVRQLVLRIAVLGVELGDAELRMLAQVSDLEVDEAVTDLTSIGVLARTSRGVRFPHDSVREFVFEIFDEHERRLAHRDAAGLLVRQAAPVAQIAYHRDQALDPDTATPELFDRLSRLHVDAGRERLAVYDLERARWHLERALEHSRDPDQRQLAAEGLADVCLLSDDVDTAVSLYTAIIATSPPAHAVSAAAKAVTFLFSKSSNTEARQLATMALEVVGEPIPTTPIGKIAALIGAIVRSWFGPPKIEVAVREALCRLYPWLTIMSLVGDPLAVPMYVARSRWIAKGLESAPAALVGGIAASMWASLGRYRRADGIFAKARTIAEAVHDPWAQGFVSHNWAHVSLLPSDRYDEGQDMLDDAIAAFREAGDVSVAVLSIMFKGLYGLDREPAEMILGWFEEATATARRNGKFVATASLEALKLHVLARQGRTDLDERFAALTAQLDGDDMTSIERLMARVHLAFAAFEAKAWPVAIAQVRAGQADIGELPGVPEYCHEIHLVTALVMLERPMATVADRKLLRHAVGKFRRAAKNSPRLQVLSTLLDLEVAIHANNVSVARTVASEIVAKFDIHENVHVARQAHLALSRLLRGENVLAAAEHDRVARNLGRRLGLETRAMLSEFSDLDGDVDMLAFELESGLKLDESQDDIPAAGMLSSAVQSTGKRRKSSSPYQDTQADVLEAWALTSATPQRTILGDIVAPVRDAVNVSIDGRLLELRCSNPKLEVPIASGDLQIVLINLLLACRDAVGPSVAIKASLDEDVLDSRSHKIVERILRPSASASDAPTLRPGRYLAIEVTAPSPAHRLPVLSAFASLERLVQSVGGHLSATIDRKQVGLVALIPLIETPAPQVRDQPRVVIIHGEPAVRETIAAGLEQLGAKCRDFAPGALDLSKIEPATVLFVDGETLDSLAVFGPLLNLEIIEIVKRGAEPISYNHQTLRFPFALSDLEEKLTARRN